MQISAARVDSTVPAQKPRHFLALLLISTVFAALDILHTYLDCSVTVLNTSTDVKSLSFAIITACMLHGTYTHSLAQEKNSSPASTELSPLENTDYETIRQEGNWFWGLRKEAKQVHTLPL